MFYYVRLESKKANPQLLTFSQNNKVTETEQASTLLLTCSQNNKIAEIEPPISEKIFWKI